ncbi:hypothetical protein Ddc_12682 [Ditylenchus destructor]|nr:hypothetical protein Ddc_12682 [Ditylenchus destructor]
MDLRICLSLVLLCCNAIFASSECPKYEEWQNKTTSPGGPLVCALLYGDSQCVGFPLPFGINISSSDLGSDSSPVINFYTNNITALVRPGCKMYLWEGTNFTGQREHSFAYKWNIEQLKYHSASCECTVDDPDLLKCEVREQWELRKFCDFRESDIGGSCSFKLKHSYTEQKSNNATKNVLKNVAITETMADMFAEKMIESFGEKRMFSFLDTNKSDTSTHTVIVDPRSAVSIKQRSYVCGKYHIFTPEIARKSGVSALRDKWFYNPQYNTHYWFSSETQTHADAESRCIQLGGRLANVFPTDRYSLRKWFARFMITSTQWWAQVQQNLQTESIYTGQGWREAPLYKCWLLQFISDSDGFGFGEDHTSDCIEQKYNYICEKKLNI